jgi:hypothetical protein
MNEQFSTSENIPSRLFLLIFNLTTKSLVGILAITGLYFYINPLVESYDKSLSYIATFIFSMIVSTLSLIFVGSLIEKSKPKSSFYDELDSIKFRYRALLEESKDEDILAKLRYSENEELLVLNDKYFNLERYNKS